MKIAVLNDTHCGIRNSSEVFIENAERFYGEIFFPYLIEHGIRHILHLGDYYDNRKHVNFRALSRDRDFFLERLKQEKITMDIICGNHDTFYKNTNSLNSLEQLLGSYSNIDIISKPTVMEYGSLRVGLVPWICEENEAESLEFLRTARCDWIGGHFDIVGFEMLRGVECEHGLDRSAFNRYERVLSGHFHTKSTQDNIMYLGSQMEFTWSDAHDDKFFHVIDTEKRTTDAVRNPHSIFHRIAFDSERSDWSTYDVSQLDGKYVKLQVVKKTDQSVLDSLIERINNRPVLDLKVAESYEAFMGNAVDDEDVSVDDTATLVNTYIDAVDTDLNKNTLKERMSNLMSEAQSMDLL